MPKIISSAIDERWTDVAINALEEAISNVLRKKDHCNFFLTGGSTAEKLYSAWSESSFLKIAPIHFYLGDERWVPENHPESNYGMIMRVLFPHGLPQNCTINKINTQLKSLQESAASYACAIPNEIDVILLSVGLDGHIASLFPNSPELRDQCQKFIHVANPKRISIAPGAIKSADEIVLLGVGTEKGRVLARALKSPMDILSLPVCLTIEGTWILDGEAFLQLPEADALLER